MANEDIQALAFCRAYDNAARERAGAARMGRADPAYPTLTEVGDDIQKQAKWRKHQDWLTYRAPADSHRYRVQLFVNSVTYAGGFDGEPYVSMYPAGAVDSWYADLEDWFELAEMHTATYPTPKWSFRRIAGTAAGEYDDWPEDPADYEDQNFYDAPYQKLAVGDYLQGAWLYTDLANGYRTLVWTHEWLVHGEEEDHPWVDGKRGIGDSWIDLHSEDSYAAIQAWAEGEYDAYVELPADAFKPPMAYHEVLAYYDDWLAVLQRTQSKAQTRVPNDCECDADFYFLPARIPVFHGFPQEAQYVGNGDFPDGGEIELWKKSTVHNAVVDDNVLTEVVVKSGYIGTDPDPGNYPAWHPDPPGGTYFTYGYIISADPEYESGSVVVRWNVLNGFIFI